MLQWAKEFLHENPDMHGPDDPLQVPLAFPQRAPPVQLPPLQTYDEKWAEDYFFNFFSVPFPYVYIPFI